MGIVNKIRARSLRPVHFCTGCCSMEMLTAMSPEFDLERYGIMPMPTPRQADVYFISGLLTKKVLPVAKRVFNRMPRPKRIIAVGACAIDGGIYRDSYSTVTNVAEEFDIDVFVPGCPPRAEAIAKGRVKLREKINRGEKPKNEVKKNEGASQ